MTTKTCFYDLIVIGAGPGGYTLAINSAKLNKKVLLIEEQQVGGTCLNRGCIPTKALLHSAKLMASLIQGTLFGITSSEVELDLEQVYRQKEQVVSSLREGLEKLIDSKKIEVLYGKAKVLDSKIVEVNNQLITGEIVVLATGCTPYIPFKFEQVAHQILTSDQVLLHADSMKEILIVGGGVIGIEMAFFYQNIGCQVTIMEQENRLLSNFDREVSQNLSRILKKLGVSIRTEYSIQSIEKEGEGFLVEYETPKSVSGETSKQVMRIETILFATGRKANTAELFGEKYAHLCGKFIPVTEDFQTEIPGVYAIGDVVLNNQQFAHKAMMDAKILCNQLFREGWKMEEVKHNIFVPSCVYIQPEIAMVGLQESEAKTEFEHIKIVKQVMHQLGKQKIVNGERSFLKLFVDTDQMILVGAVLMCEQACELISYLTLAIQEKIPISRLASIIYPHPTFSEALGECFDQIQEDRSYGL